MRTITFSITGMTCGGCVAAVRNVLGRQAGVSDVKVDVGSATLTFDESKVDEKSLVAAIERAGFAAAAA
jgi:copper chaperone